MEKLNRLSIIDLLAAKCNEVGFERIENALIKTNSNISNILWNKYEILIPAIQGINRQDIVTKIGLITGTNTRKRNRINIDYIMNDRSRRSLENNNNKIDDSNFNRPETPKEQETNVGRRRDPHHLDELQKEMENWETYTEPSNTGENNNNDGDEFEDPANMLAYIMPTVHNTENVPLFSPSGSINDRANNVASYYDNEIAQWRNRHPSLRQSVTGDIDHSDVNADTEVIYDDDISDGEDDNSGNENNNNTA